MTRTASRQHSIEPLPRRVSIGHHHARGRDAPGNRPVDQSSPRDAGSGHRYRPIGFATSSTAPYTGGQRSLPTNPNDEIPIASDAPPRPTSRAFSLGSLRTPTLADI